MLGSIKNAFIKGWDKAKALNRKRVEYMGKMYRGYGAGVEHLHNMRETIRHESEWGRTQRQKNIAQGRNDVIEKTVENKVTAFVKKHPDSKRMTNKKNLELKMMLIKRRQHEIQARKQAKAAAKQDKLKAMEARKLEKAKIKEAKKLEKQKAKEVLTQKQAKIKSQVDARNAKMISNGWANRGNYSGTTGEYFLRQKLNENGNKYYMKVLNFVNSRGDTIYTLFSKPKKSTRTSTGQAKRAIRRIQVV